MKNTESPTAELHGIYRDVLYDASGQVLWDRGWKSNAIVGDCRRLLATFMGGTSPSLGIQGLRVGMGLDSWDATGAPAATATQAALVDTNSFKVLPASLQIDFLDGGGVVSPNPTNRLQIVATLGPHVPSWPDGNHVTSNLREFGLIGSLKGAETLINYVTHPVIVKDPLSTLTRTIWLTF
jgi:hypothetical protein